MRSLPSRPNHPPQAPTSKCYHIGHLRFNIWIWGGGQKYSDHSSNFFFPLYTKSVTYLNSSNAAVSQLGFTFLFYSWGNGGSEVLIPAQCHIAHTLWRLCLPGCETFGLFNATLLLCTISFHSSTAQWSRPHYCHFKNQKRTSGRWLYQGHTGSLPHFDSIFIHKIELFHLWEIHWRNQIKLQVIKIMQEGVKSWLIRKSQAAMANWRLTRGFFLF